MSLQAPQPSHSEYEEDLEGADERKKGHSKNSSHSDRDRKIGHRRINEEGQVSYKKIETNQLMGSIQLGIQASIGGLAKYPDRDLLMQDFMKVETTQFSKHGSKQTPAHSYADFTFRTYAPVAFRYFRDLFGIQPEDFMMSICNEPMRELSNPGASGSIFYLTRDDEFILKTVSMKEAEFLQKLLPGYYMNLQQNPRTTLPKFFGMFCYQCNQKNIRLVVMNNLLPSIVKMHLKFDLKGSTYKRKASKHEREKNSPTFKDLDFLELLPEGLLLEPDTYTAIVKTMSRDCRVLESFKIMDYSLLVGIHNLDLAAREREEEAASEGTEQIATKKDRLVAHSTAMESIQATSDPVDIPGELPPGGIPARNHKGERLLLFVGIIDILQSYRLIKKLEHTFKAMIHDGDTVSVHRPGFYAERFLNFMSGKIFKKISSLDLPEVKGSHRKFRTVVASLIALKHSPSKRTKSVKKPVSHQDGTTGAPPYKEDTLQGMAKISPKVSSVVTERLSNRLDDSNTEDAIKDDLDLQPQAASLTAPVCYLPSVLRDRPQSSKAGAGRGVPPPVPPRSPRKLTEAAPVSTHRGMVGIPDVVPDSSSQAESRRNVSAEALSISDVSLETGNHHHHSTNSLRTPSLMRRSGRTPTPTWTEGTPSYTESTVSEEQAFSLTPSHSNDIGDGEALDKEEDRNSSSEVTRL